MYNTQAKLEEILKSRMWEIYKYGSVRGLPFSNLGKR